MSKKNASGLIRRFFRKNGLYMALCGCVAAAALLSYNAAGDMLHRLLGGGEPLTQQQSTAPPITQQITELPQEQLQETLRPKKDLPAEAEQETAVSESALFEPIYCAPVAGSVINPFSNYELVKSETMNDWRTHNGADLAVDAGSEAVAVYAGTVIRTQQDPLWGGCVTLRLDTGYEVTYAGLAAVFVQEGQRVSQGEAVGTVGTAPAESALPSHLHFEVMSGISYIDPAVLLGS